MHACRLTSVSLTGPEPISTNPLRRVAFELQTERRARGGYPPGDTSPSVRRTHRMIADPLAPAARRLRAPRPGLLAADPQRAQRLHARAGGEPLHARLPRRPLPLARRRLRRPDPAARRRDAHDRRRLPQAVAPDHAPGLPPRARRRRRSASWTRRSSARSRGWHDGLELDLYALGARARAAGRACARCSASTPTRPARPATSSARSASTAASTGCRSCAARARRGRSCKRRATRLDRLIYAEIADRRRTGRARRRRALAAARRPAQRPPRARPRDDAAVRGPRHHDRDRRVPVLRARPPPGDRRRRRRRPAAARPGARRDAAPLPAGLDRPAPRRPRRSSSAATAIAEGAPVNYSSWASHRLPDVWEEPDAFRPERFAPEARKRIPKGAYVPFGGGSRICLGMRFGQAEIRAIATRRERALPRRVARPASGCGSGRRRRSARRVDSRCESGCRFRSEEVVPEGEGGPTWLAASR